MISVKSNSLSLKCKRFTLSGCEDFGIRKFEFVAKTSSFFANVIIKKKNCLEIRKIISK